MKKQPAPPINLHQAANELANNIANWREIMAPLDEATAGYRAQLESDGWSTPAAEQMAIGFYTLQMSMLTQHANKAIAQTDS